MNAYSLIFAHFCAWISGKWVSTFALRSVYVTLNLNRALDGGCNHINWGCMFLRYWTDTQWSYLMLLDIIITMIVLPYVSYFRPKIRKPAIFNSFSRPLNKQGQNYFLMSTIEFNMPEIVGKSCTYPLNFATKSQMWPTLLYRYKCRSTTNASNNLTTHYQRV